MTRPAPARAPGPGPRTRRPHHAVDSDHIAQRSRAEQYIAGLSAPARTQRLAAEVAARHQQRLAVDHLSRVLLTRQPLPPLRAGSPSRSADIASVAQEPMESERGILILEWPMNEEIVSHAYGADDPGLPSPPAVTDSRHMLREQSLNASANAEPRLGPTVPAAVRRWKLWLLTVCGIYPTIVLLGLATNPVLEDLYLPVRLAVLVPAAAAAMVWQINPRLQRHFGAWLTR
ncbi:hypothetical protein [Streptomyces sp. enrichment culture]|uniref:hypothetical protein n=1 Tax=Streptomyces sp. enrichment culture TaxID=1795815 RepID=UPI003F57CB7B